MDAIRQHVRVTFTFPVCFTTGVFEAVKGDVAQSSIRIGHMGALKSTHPDYYPVQVLNEVLSGSFTSRLFSSVRTEKGLAYSVGGAVGSAVRGGAGVGVSHGGGRRGRSRRTRRRGGARHARCGRGPGLWQRRGGIKAHVDPDFDGHEDTGSAR